MAAMHSWRWIVVLAIALLWPGPRPVAEIVGASRSDLIRSLLPTVVNIAIRKEVAPDTGGANAASAAGDQSDIVKTFVGSGFIIDPSGLIVTNNHVVEGAFEITVTLSDDTVLPAKLLHASRVGDLAVLQVDAGHKLTAVQWGDSNKVRVGDQVIAIGNPLGVGMSVSGGIVSGLDRDLQESPYDDYIQTDAANSGGPLFNMEGHVIGVNSALFSPTEASAGLGLAKPSADAQFVIGRLMKYGWVDPGWIGVKVQQMTRAMAEALGMKQPEGSVVAWVIPNGPAHKAGIAIGDVIVKYGGDTPSDERALLRDIGETPTGETVPLTVLRNGVEHSIPVTIMSWPRSQWEQRDAPVAAERPKVTIPRNLGLSLAAMEPDQRARFGLEDGTTGVLITAVMPNTDAARIGATGGDVILQVQNQPVATPGDVQGAIDATRAEGRPYVMMLVLPKVRAKPGPSWVTLRLTASDAD
jgi:serine protease Do